MGEYFHLTLKKLTLIRPVCKRFCQTRANAEITELLRGLKRRHDVLNLPQPKMMVADNCCHIHGAVASAMPETEAKLDVWHFSARYVTSA